MSFVAVADGLAMLLPGPSSKPGGAAILLLGVAWWALGIPGVLSTSGRPFTAILIARFGLLVLPVLIIPVAGLWFVATPVALSRWFVVAWFSVWLLCALCSAFLPCPGCGQPFGRLGFRLQTRASACPHCGANPRATES